MVDLDRLKAERWRIEETLRNAGCTLRGTECRCPFPEHIDKHASAGIFEGTSGAWLFKCVPCHFSGSFLDLEARLAGRSPVEIIKGLDERQGSTAKPPTKEAEYVYPTLELLEASFKPTWEGRWEYTNPETGKPDLIIYRIPREGGGKKFSQVSPRPNGWTKHKAIGQQPLYNRVGILNKPTIVVTEGEKAADALIRIGIPATTSPMGAGSSGYADWSPVAGKNVYLWPDNDGVGPRGLIEGLEHMKDIAKILEPLGCKTKIVDISKLGLPKKGDAYEFVNAIDGDIQDKAKAVKTALMGAEDTGLMKELRERAAQIGAGLRRPVEWPWRRFTELTGFSIPGTVSLLCGDGGSTKSFWLIEATSHWHEMKIPFAMFQLEDERALHAYRALAQRERKPEMMDNIWGEAHEDEMNEIFRKHADFVATLGASLDGETKENITYKGLLEWTEKRAKMGAKIIAIDPITMAAPEKEQFSADKNFTDNLKRIAREHKVSIVLVIHPRKGRKGSISLDDLAGGSAFGRFSHCVVWLDNHGEPVRNVVKDSFATMERLHNRTMHIVKARNARGQGVRIAFNFNPDLTFTEYGIVLSKEAQKNAPSVSAFEQRAIAVSQQQRVAAPAIEQTYEDPDDDQDLF